MSDLTNRANVIHDALMHCYNDRGCVACPFYDNCEGDVSVLIYESADVLANLIHEMMVAEYNVPTVDAEPVRHSKWVEDPNRRNHWHCSECKDVWGIVSRVMNYCPKCGAKMDAAKDATTTEEEA